MAILYFRFGSRPTHEPRRAPLLEALLCRAAPAQPVPDWRAHAVGLAAPGRAPPGVACALRTAALEEVPSQGSLFVATPVHLVAGLNGVSLAATLELSAMEAEQLVMDFNALFGASGLRLVPARHGRLLCALATGPRDPSALPATRDPERLLGEDIREHLPAGAAGAPLRRLMTELQMWLHAHALNEARRARRAPEIAGLWLWGGVAAEERLPELPLWSHGADPLFDSYAPQSRYPAGGAPSAGGSSSAGGSPSAGGPERASGTGPAGGAAGAAAVRPSGVVVRAEAPGDADSERFESEWLAPALADLRAGRLERIELCAGPVSRTLSRAATYRWWRRALPWWDALQVRMV